jgi:GST-like protein
MLELLTSETPNGWKTSICLEELGVPYKVTPISLSAQDQKRPEFLALNPNGKIPVLVDHDAGGFAVFESGAILTYLAEKFGRFLPSDAQGRSAVLQWVFWQVGGLGPMMGQATVFNRYFPEKIPAVIERYTRESRRLLGILDAELASREYIAGDYSIADMAIFPWAQGAGWAGIDIADLPHLNRWMDGLRARPAVQRGLLIPTPPTPEEMAAKTTAQGKAILA